jgi:hypothetical protein
MKVFIVKLWRDVLKIKSEEDADFLWEIPTDQSQLEKLTGL